MIRRLFLLWAVAAFTVAVGCDNKGNNIGGNNPGGNNPAGNLPVPAFTATPTDGLAPLTVSFTNGSSNFTSSNWDFGDGNTSPANNPAHTYTQAGTFTVRLTVTNGVGSEFVEKVGYITVNAPSVDIDVDTNRDGTITNNAADDTNEDQWTASGGAVFYQNLDDDNLDGTRDFFDTTVNGTLDAADLTRIVVRSYNLAPANGSVNVTVDPAAARSRVRIFRKTGTTTWTGIFSPGSTSFNLPVADVIAGDIELGIEATNQMSGSWDGIVSLTLTVRDASNAIVGTDTVTLRSAPWIMATNLWRVEEVIVCNLGAENAAFRNTMASALTGMGISLHEYASGSYGGDRWIQDSQEPGVFILPDAVQPRRHLDVTLQCARWRPADLWCVDNHLKSDFGVVLRFSAADQSLNYGGNLECIPPHTAPGNVEYPFGRIIYGGGTAGTVTGWPSGHSPSQMDALYQDFFDANSLQGPSVEISSEWLGVGHIDEFSAFLPAPARARGWVVAYASPDLARSILQTVKTNGGGAAPVFLGRASEATVDEILNDSTLMQYNDLVQARLDSIKTVLKNTIGLTDADFVELPILFEPLNADGDAVALNPGVVNMVCVPAANGHIRLFVPDPEGPHVPTDVWADETRNKLQALGTGAAPVTVTFVDVFEAYHEVLGEAHCGTNAVRTPPADQWWDK